jgi:uncharacterized RDD family membrane protein YckC
MDAAAAEHEASDTREFAAANRELIEEYRYKVSIGYIAPRDLVSALIQEGLSPQIAERAAHLIDSDWNDPLSISQPPGTVYAGFIIRAGALIFDLLLMMVLPAAVVAYWLSSTPDSASSNWIYFYCCVFWLIYTILAIRFTGTTIGKKLCSLHVADAHTLGRPSLTQAVFRTLGYYLSSLVGGLGFYWVAFDRKRHRGWHDSLADTVVLRRPPSRQHTAIAATVFALVIGSFSWQLLSRSFTESSVGPSSSIGASDVSGVLGTGPTLFNDPDGVFAVDFPGRPTVTTEPLSVGTHAITATSYSVRTDTKADYVVFQGSLKTLDAESLLDEYVEALSYNADAIYQTERLTVSAGVRALDFSVRFQGRLANGRLYVSGEHVVLAIVADETDHTRVDQFLTSLRILQL